MGFKVRFLAGTSDVYNSITPDPYSFYFTTDDHKVYLGPQELTNSSIADVIAQLQSLAYRVTVVQHDKLDMIIKTSQEWQQRGTQISGQNTFYIYSDRDSSGLVNLPGIKIGDGVTQIQDLPFIDQSLVSKFDLLETKVDNHINNTNVHIQTGERSYWNNKIKIDSVDAENQNLIFTDLI